ncbi:MAG: hypothetical protein R3Y09_02120 [Clostridia bacterium]
MNISKLCRNDEEKLCVYCTFSSDVLDNNNVLCKKRGMVAKNHTCRKYKYDPLKRTPPARVKMRKAFKTEDFDI